ncbi:MAG: hypothetical protein ABIB61_01960 [Candidatus Shapirobacteria bacterium]
MNKALLVTRPNHDLTTNYLFCWSLPVIKEARKKDFQVLDLEGNKANKKNFDSHIKRHRPILVFFNGHGSKEMIGGFDNEVLVRVDRDEKLLSEKMVYARSCDSAEELGYKCVRKGTIVFIGYRRKYFLVYSQSKSTRPQQDEVAKLFLEPSNLVPISLLKGNTASISFKKSQGGMRRNLRFMLSSKASQVQRDAAPYLWRNIKSQVVIGNKKAKI